MVRQSSRTGFPVGNPLANVLVVIVGVLTIAVSVVLGFFAFLALSAIVFVAAAVIGIRVWWLNRKLHHNVQARRGQPGQGEARGVIEGEYRVISRDRDEA